MRALQRDKARQIPKMIVYYSWAEKWDDYRTCSYSGVHTVYVYLWVRAPSFIPRLRDDLTNNFPYDVQHSDKAYE